MWLNNYLKDDKDFQNDLESLWQEIKPLYEKVHAYVRYRLKDKWGADKIDAEKALPAHIFGNMWAQEWSKTLKIVMPYPEESNPLDDVNANLKNQVILQTKLPDFFQ